MERSIGYCTPLWQSVNTTGNLLAAPFVGYRRTMSRPLQAVRMLCAWVGGGAGARSRGVCTKIDQDCR